MDWPVATKVCSKCGKEKQLEEFYWRSDKEHLTSQCKECIRTNIREKRHKVRPPGEKWQLAQKSLRKCFSCGTIQPIEKFPCSKNKAKGHSHICSECQAELGRAWYEANKEAMREKHRQWYRANRDIVYQNKLRRNARQAQVLHRLNQQDIEEIKTNKCFFCGSDKDLTIAHNIPLSRGGPTARPNLFCLCRSCNSQMHTKSLAEVLEQKAFLEAKNEYGIRSSYT